MAGQNTCNSTACLRRRLPAKSDLETLCREYAPDVYAGATDDSPVRRHVRRIIYINPNI